MNAISYIDFCVKPADKLDVLERQLGSHMTKYLVHDEMKDPEVLQLWTVQMNHNVLFLSRHVTSNGPLDAKPRRL